MPGKGGAQGKGPHLRGLVGAAFGAGAGKRKRPPPECLRSWRRRLWEPWPGVPGTPTWTATNGTVSWSRGRSRRPTLAAKPSCRTTTGAPSTVCSVVRESTTRKSATTSDAFQRSSRARTAVARAVARETPTRTVARGSPRVMAMATVDEEALTASRTRKRMRTSPEGIPILHQGGNLSPLVGNQTRDLRPVPGRKPNKLKN